MPTSTLDNERIVKAKYLLRRARIGRVGSTSSLGANAVNLPYGPFVPEGDYATDPEILAIRDALYEAEARLWAYNLMDLYTGDPAKPIDRRQSSLLSGFNTRYGRISSALGRPDLQQLPIVVEARALYETMNAYRTSAGYATMDTSEANAASPVVTLINNMDWNNSESVAAARSAYDALAPRGKARVTNYDMLKKAEGTYGKIPANITSVGGRAPSNGNGYSIAQWQNLADQFEGMFPGVPTEHIWIAGMLSGGITSGTGGVRVNGDFNSIATDGKYAPPGYTPLTLAEWRDRHIDFAMSGTGRPTHEEFLTYYDTAGTKVWLQVENGYADMITLIDIYKDIFKVNQHPSVLGFAVDVEWYFGVEEDMGIPVPDAKAKEWNEHIYSTWGPSYGLLLKHYTTSYLPYTYRGGEPGKSNKVVFCNDSQGSQTVASYMQGFQDFAAMYPDNKIVDQVGYAPDRAWFMALTDPVVKSKSVMLAECALASPTQEKGIVWVQGTFNDPLTFYLGTDAQAASAVNSTLGYLVNDNLTSWTSNDSPGYRLRRTLAGQTSSVGTLADALFVKAMRKSVNALPNGESNSSLTAARVEALKGFEAVAVDIRVKALPAVANLVFKRDAETVYAIWDTYQELTDVQKAEVKEFAALQAAKEMMDELGKPAIPVLFENGQWAEVLGEITVQTPRSIHGHYLWSYENGMIRLTNDVSGPISTGGQNSIPFRWQFQNTIDIRGYSAVVIELDEVPAQPFLRQLRFRIDEDNTSSGVLTSSTVRMTSFTDSQRLRGIGALPSNGDVVRIKKIYLEGTGVLAAPANVSRREIRDIIPPRTGNEPVREITSSPQYTGTVAWSPDHDVFEENTVYTATITLAPREGWTLAGVAANWFRLYDITGNDAANTLTHAAGSSVITKTFAATTPVLPYPDPTQFVVLSFDDTISPETNDLLDVLDSIGAKANFFTIGMNLEKSNRFPEYARVVSRLKNDGHEPGNHTWQHERWTRATQDVRLADWTANNNYMIELFGKAPTWIRFPYNDQNASAVSDASALNLANLWGFDTNDWSIDRSASYLINRVLVQTGNNAARDGQIYVHHDHYDNQNSTRWALPELAHYLRSMGIDYMTASELSKRNNITVVPGTTYNNFFLPSRITIGTQPAANTVVTEGKVDAGLTVSATVSPAASPSYQWFIRSAAAEAWTAVDGGTGAALELPKGLTEGTYYFYAVAS
ncbi:MAG: polysaccharide deacetylase family protein, partial [Clostridiales bacterium]|nr:polysaccharide deacetylase family protein [Clostridiales bacterium]